MAPRRTCHRAPQRHPRPSRGQPDQDRLARTAGCPPEPEVAGSNPAAHVEPRAVHKRFRGGGACHKRHKHPGRSPRAPADSAPRCRPPGATGRRKPRRPAPPRRSRRGWTRTSDQVEVPRPRAVVRRCRLLHARPTAPANVVEWVCPGGGGRHIEPSLGCSRRRWGPGARRRSHAAAKARLPVRQFEVNLSERCNRLGRDPRRPFLDEVGQAIYAAGDVHSRPRPPASHSSRNLAGAAVTTKPPPPRRCRRRGVCFDGGDAWR